MICFLSYEKNHTIIDKKKIKILFFKKKVRNIKTLKKLHSVFLSNSFFFFKNCLSSFFEETCNYKNKNRFRIRRKPLSICYCYKYLNFKLQPIIFIQKSILLKIFILNLKKNKLNFITSLIIIKFRSFFFNFNWLFKEKKRKDLLFEQKINFLN